MNEWQTARNRRIVGTLLAIRNAPAGEYNFERFFEDRVEEFLSSQATASFSMLLAAQLVGDSARLQRGFGEREFVGLGLPAAAEGNPDIVMAFRLAVVIMNRDIATAKAIVDTITQSRSRSRNVLACLLGMLTEARQPVS